MMKGNIIEVMSFEVNHRSVTMLYDGVGWIVNDGEFREYYRTFPEASDGFAEKEKQYLRK